LAFKAFPDILYFEVNKGVRLEKDTSQYDRFVELPFPVSFSVYLFHIENSEEILTGAKPNITEVGPYVYKQTRRKTVLYTDSEEDVIAYTQQETFEFDAAASSPRKEDDRVIALNAPLMSIYQIAEPMGVLVSAVVDNCIKSTFQANYGQIFINISVRELLFDGLNFCRNTEDNACSYINNIVCKQAATKRNVDVLEDSSLRFSYLNYKQKEPDGKYVVKRGIDDIEQLGHIVTWNDMKYTHYWGENTTCSEVKGTDSTVYPPRVKKDNSFFIYATDIC
ncbi:sensory neuron membrane protein 2, partial [Asbolus verrucosus]